MTDTTLLPCPFCGGRAIVTNQTAGKRASCLTCRARGPLVPVLSKGPTAYERAIDAWNRRDQWRPIESAPKDGTVILGWHDDIGYGFTCEWSGRHKCWYDAGRYAVSPTHYMLITPPAPASGGK